MGKKKDERKRREREAASHRVESQRTDDKAGDRAGAFGAKYGWPGKLENAAPMAGIASAIARQMGTPAGRQVIAAGLMAAASAIARQDTKQAAPPSSPPAPPAPPPPPPTAEPLAKAHASTERSTGPFAGETPEPPRADSPALPLEVAKVIASVSTGLERWVTGLGKPAKGKDSGE
ncbi:hypothetical protein U1707_04100 [Sphingomonas sp. PB2P12]|uniref:hypothetical protein n=1 Tax=Sphingomonas sandaracina TaxID=3096157 RepID=UPI002FC6E832